jgi:hypothetical protein
MPQGKGTYGSKVGRPPKKAKKPAKNGKFAETKFGRKVINKTKAKKKPAVKQQRRTRGPKD